jgi:hypothetical protein
MAKANKFPTRSLKTELHQINLLIHLCSHRKLIVIKLKTLRQKSAQSEKSVKEKY